jgi:hypothetical protein
MQNIQPGQIVGVSHISLEDAAQDYSNNKNKFFYI